MSLNLVSQRFIFEKLRDRHLACLARLYFHDLRKNRWSVALCVCLFVSFVIEYGPCFIFVEK